jgi:maleate cis-trans isomerase
MTPAILELLKLSISVYFSVAKMNNVSEEELEEIFKEEKEKFSQNTPDQLEDV